MVGQSLKRREQVRTTLSWSTGSNRSIVFIGDSQAHTPSMTKLQMEQYGISNPRIIDWRVEADECWKAGIKIYAVQCLNESRATNFYKSIAARTCGAYVQLSDFKDCDRHDFGGCFP